MATVFPVDDLLLRRDALDAHGGGDGISVAVEGGAWCGDFEPRSSVETSLSSGRNPGDGILTKRVTGAAAGEGAAYVVVSGGGGAGLGKTMGIAGRFQLNRSMSESNVCLAALVRNAGHGLLPKSVSKEIVAVEPHPPTAKSLITASLITSPAAVAVPPLPSVPAPAQTSSQPSQQPPPSQQTVASSTCPVGPNGLYQTFYKRPLPDTCVAFQSAHGKTIFCRAVHTPYMEAYYALSMHYTTQNEPAYCGLTTLCMVLNTLEVDPLRRWKGPWRWYDEEMLECCRPLSEVKEEGITLMEFDCTARCNGLKAVTVRADKTTKEEFVRDIKRAARSRSEVMVVSFSRQSLQQTGSGHFSPIGGYDEVEDKVLIFDVARFKYPAYWVSVDALWDSLHPVDEATGHPRGYTMLKRAERGIVHSAMARFAQDAPNVWPVISQAIVETTADALSHAAGPCLSSSSDSGADGAVEAAFPAGFAKHAVSKALRTCAKDGEAVAAIAKIVRSAKAKAGADPTARLFAEPFDEDGTASFTLEDRDGEGAEGKDGTGRARSFSSSGSRAKAPPMAANTGELKRREAEANMMESWAVGQPIWHEVFDAVGAFFAKNGNDVDGDDEYGEVIAARSSRSSLAAGNGHSRLQDFCTLLTVLVVACLRVGSVGWESEEVVGCKMDGLVWKEVGIMMREAEAYLDLREGRKEVKSF
ncbi:hypothetical protein HDU97_006749 [Phlyctochytrium planicorne]|nr:hypothetical protein HDU97_006749 [Phlyctochytrium planicorne]